MKPIFLLKRKIQHDEKYRSETEAIKFNNSTLQLKYVIAKEYFIIEFFMIENIHSNVYAVLRIFELCKILLDHVGV